MKKIEEQSSSVLFDCDIEADSDDDADWENTHKLMAIIGDEDTCVGFMLGGIGELNELQEPNYYVVHPKTEDYKVRIAFENFAARKDIAIILITKEASEKIHNVVKHYKGHFPALLVIPGHNGPFDVDLPPEVQEIEDRRAMYSSENRRSSTGSTSSLGSRKSIDDHHKSRSYQDRSGNSSGQSTSSIIEMCFTRKKL